MHAHGELVSRLERDVESYRARHQDMQATLAKRSSDHVRLDAEHETLRKKHALEREQHESSKHAVAQVRGAIATAAIDIRVQVVLTCMSAHLRSCVCASYETNLLRVAYKTTQSCGSCASRLSTCSVRTASSACRSSALSSYRGLWIRLADRRVLPAVDKQHAVLQAQLDALRTEHEHIAAARESVLQALHAQVRLASLSAYAYVAMSRSLKDACVC